MKQPSARDFMVTRLVTIRPETDVLEAVRVLLKNRISGAPVVDEANRYLGVFSEKCSMNVILDAAYEQLPSNQVRVFMDTEAKTIGPDTQLLSIAQIFLLTSYRRLPVLENGYLLGQVSRRDVLAAAVEVLHRAPAREARSSTLYLSAVRESGEVPLS